MGLYLRPLMRLLVACLSTVIVSLAASTAAQGAIGFALAPGSPVGTSTDHAAGLATGDLNGDGRPDLVSAGHDGDAGAGFITAFLGDGDGNSPARRRVATGGDGARAVVLNDLSGDGMLDAVTANLDSGTVSVLLGDGGGGFAAGIPLDAHEKTTDLVVDNFTADRIPDVAATNDLPGSNGSVSLLPGT